MTTDYRLLVAGLGSYASTKGYKMLPDAIENNKLPEDSHWKVTRPDQTRPNTLKSSQLQ